MLGSCVSYSSTLNMEAIFSIETAIDFQQTTQHYNPQDRTIIATAAKTSNPIFLRSVHRPKNVYDTYILLRMFGKDKTAHHDDIV
jgi:hypothetical protein